MDRQPPPDNVVKELQELAATYRRLNPHKPNERLLTMQLMELISEYGIAEVLRVLSIIQRNMDITVSSAGDPRR